MKKKIRPLIQLTQTECGLCCCLMLLKSFGARETMANLRRDFEVGRDGTSMKELAEILRSRNAEVKLFRANYEGLRQLEQPFIAYWDRYHFVIVESMSATEATIVDPAQGRRLISKPEFESSFSDVAMAVAPGSGEPYRAPEERSAWRHFLSPLLKSPKRLIAVVLLSLLSYCVTIAVPQATQTLIDSREGASIGLSTIWVAVFGILAGYFLLLVLRVLVTSSMTVTVGRHSMSAVYGHLLSLPYKYFGARSPGELSFRLNSVNGIRDMVSAQLVAGIIDGGMLLCILGYMLTKSWQLTLVSGTFFLVMSLLLLQTRGKVSEAIDSEMSELSRSQSLQLESIESIASLKLAGMEANFFDTWRHVFERSLDRFRRRSVLQGVVSSAISVAQTTAPIVILLVGLGLVSSGQASLGLVIGFQVISATFFSLATSIYSSYTQVLSANSYIDRISDITTTPGDDLDRLGSKDPVAGSVTLDAVTFRYSTNGPVVLRDVSFSVRSGEKLAIVGASGSGKSTLGKLLVGLYQPSSGEILFDGRPINTIDRRVFYDSIAMVPQDVKLQNRSIEDNIRMSNYSMAIEEVEHSARAAQIHEEIGAMPMAYKTLVSELGSNLSGGQRQRIALARALAKRPRILVLDEATSSLDAENEARIFVHLSTQSCTRIVIAHRLSTIVDADRILVMKDGEIADTGTHSDLISKEGPYRDLFEAQRQDTSDQLDARSLST